MDISDEFRQGHRHHHKFPEAIVGIFRRVDDFDHALKTGLPTGPV
jgi:hypothetical protein